MLLELPPRAALGDAVADILRRAILDGSLKPGQKLHENALARQLAVSRSPIREALIQLERERLVDGRLNRSAVVRRALHEVIGCRLQRIAERRLEREPATGGDRAGGECHRAADDEPASGRG